MHRSAVVPPPLYFDNNATTALDPAVVDTMLPYLTELYGNPSSAYGFGSRVGKAIEIAREQVAALVGCEPREIVFTSCGTEGSNAALAAALAADPDRRHVVTTTVEHSAVKNHADRLARQGYEVTRLRVDRQGRLDLAAVAEAIREDTAVVSVMWANNETGVLFPVAEIAAMARARGAFSTRTPSKPSARSRSTSARTPTSSSSPSPGTSSTRRRGSARSTSAAACAGRRISSVAARKRPARRHRERRRHRRPGQSRELAAAAMDDENTRVRALRDRFEAGILETIPGTEVNGDPAGPLAQHRQPVLPRRGRRSHARPVRQGRPVRQRRQRLHHRFPAPLATS